jgi:hypothetical protein
MWARHIPLQLVDLRMEHQVNRFMGCDYPYNATFLALRLSALTMCEIRLVIAPLHPGHAGEALLNRIRMQG